MTESFGEFFSPGLAHLNREQERQRNDIHQLIVDAPPWDCVLDSGRITLEAPVCGPAAQSADTPPDTSSRPAAD
ncbi:MAG: hypothetical protein LBE08_08745 [Bifidobacteriaceae bacterium]|jgi:hypothetical protein|nr:hypothetical protein [Bifidobacteriaceae bacterium]